MLPSVLPTKLGKSTVDSSIEVDGVENKAHWLRLKVLSWTDQEGRKRKWEMAERKTTSKSGVDAVAIVSVLSHPSKPLSIPIVSHNDFDDLTKVTHFGYRALDPSISPASPSYLRRTSGWAHRCR